MRRSVAHNRSLAWLAMLALCLTVLAPVVSRTLAATRMPTAICHGQAPMSAMADMPMVATIPDPHDPPHDESMEACGYCGLLGHSPLLFSMAFVAMLPPSAPTLAARLPALTPPPFTPGRAHAPRGPPHARLA